MENQFKRKIPSQSGEKREKCSGYMMTKREDKMVKEFVRRLGYDKPRDFLVATASQGSIEKEMRYNRNSQQRIRISHLAGYIRQIDSGIQVEQAKEKIVSEVRMLCQDYI